MNEAGTGCRGAKQGHTKGGIQYNATTEPIRSEHRQGGELEQAQKELKAWLRAIADAMRAIEAMELEKKPLSFPNGLPNTSLNRPRSGLVATPLVCGWNYSHRRNLLFCALAHR